MGLVGLCAVHQPEEAGQAATARAIPPGRNGKAIAGWVSVTPFVQVVAQRPASLPGKAAVATDGRRGAEETAGSQTSAEPRRPQVREALKAEGLLKVAKAA